MLAAGATFAVIYGLRGDDGTVEAIPGEPTPPSDDVTPAPSSTPDTTQDFWYVPYQNAERAAPKFTGTLNGFSFDPNFVDTRTAIDVCPPYGLELARADAVERSANDGELDIDVSSLPPGVSPIDPPEVWLCDGRAFSVHFNLSVAAGVSGAEASGSGLRITRLRGLRTISDPVSEPRLGVTEVAGQPAVTIAPVVEADGFFIGGCTLYAYDDANDTFTAVSASAASVEFCREVAEAVLR